MSPSATSPMLVYPTLDPDRSLRWHVRCGDAAATLDVASGEVFRNAAARSPKMPFQTVVGALAEYYRTDAAEYGGENLAKMLSELRSRRAT